MTDAVPFDPENLPEFRRWADGFILPVEGVDYVRNHLSTTQASIFLRMILPGFVEQEGCIVVDFLTSETAVRSWRQVRGDNKAAIESGVNRLILWDWFDPDDAIEERALVDMAERIAIAWKQCASNAFPGRTFRSWVNHDYGPTVVLCTTDGDQEATR